MAIRKRSSSTPSTHQVLFLWFIVFELSSSFLFSNTSGSNVDENGGELRLLLSFKSSLNDPFHFLSEWTADNGDNLCQWRGVACDKSFRVVSVSLAAKNISGRVSAPIFQLPGIQTLDLSCNQLAGDLPRNMFSSASASLRHLNLSNNNFTGTVPGGGVPTLETFDLSNNMLSGRIPDDIGRFSGLKFLDLGGNVLSGTVPVLVSNISGLEYLTLASNQLSGEIPREMCVIKSLKWIYLGYNNFSGKIPREIGDLASLRHLDLVYNNLTGSIPESFGNLTELRYLFLYLNKLAGPVPPSVFELENLVSLDLSDNMLSGEIPETVGRLQRLEILHLFSNNFTGKIPANLASLPRLQVLQLWSNKFSGEIPGDLGRLNNLTVLDLSTNGLTGKIPANLCDSGRLFKLILFANSLEGDIPEGLSRCKSLRRVRLQKNRLSGEITADLSNLPLVYFLDISSNELSGRIDDLKWDMPSLQMLNLGENRFSGSLPESFGSEKLENLVISANRFTGNIPPNLFKNLSKLMQLNLSHNELSGYIPKEISSCQRLVNLDMSHNRLVGEIPESLAEMPVLGQLDLSVNELSGEIPRHLGRVESLVQVNVSHNHFHGSLPTTGAFLAINATAVAGNDGLCGGDTASGLPQCGDKSLINKDRRPTWWFVLSCLLAAIGLVVVAIFVAAVVFLRRRRRAFKVERVESDDGVWELQFFESNLSKSLRIEDIISSGKGNLSISNNKQFIVKEIRDVNSIPTSVWSEIGEFGRKIRHRNVVRLMGLCRSQKGGYLVYEYIEGKVLSEILKSLSWERRRKIATGVAKALRFLHGNCSPSVVVGRISSEDILVDANDEACLSLRIPGMGYSASKAFASSAYVAPEASKGSITEKSDIYGFGLLLVELLTGKSPGDAEFGGSVREAFIEWARYCYSDCHLDTWVDPAFKGHVLTDHNTIVEAMNLALHCTAADPTARPCAADVCKTLGSVARSTAATRFCSSAFKVTKPR